MWTNARGSKRNGGQIECYKWSVGLCDKPKDEISAACVQQCLK